MKYKIIRKDPRKTKIGVYGIKAIKNLEIEIWPNPYPGIGLIKKQSFPEFTSLCPRSGYPDFATVNIEVVPDKWVVEMKALKLYLNNYRDKRHSHEEVTGKIFEDIWGWIKPEYLKVTIDFTPRGNLKTVIEVERHK